MGRRPPARKPAFTKIIVTESFKKLLIPSKFVRLHRGTLARKCILRPTGTQDSWRVRTKQINNALYFKKGWRKFAQHHSLGFGDLLVFRYAQDCEFYVDMFDKSCYLKEPVTSQNVGSQEDTTPTQPRQEKKATPNTQLALKAAEEFMESSEYPAFNRIMQSAYVRVNGYMPLKPDFAKMYLKDGTREVKIEVSGRTRTVGLQKDRSTCRLGRCWGPLAGEHAIKVGDVCVFELINAEDCTLKLTNFSSTRKEKTWQTKARSGMAHEAHSSQAFAAANKYSSLSKHPSYTCVMHLSYQKARYLQVPLCFVEQMSMTEGANKVKLQCRGKEWNAVIKFHGTSAKITEGWASFAEQKALHIGDACAFELISREDALIRVTIFKCTN